MGDMLRSMREVIEEGKEEETQRREAMARHREWLAKLRQDMS
jgi:hypothetical protein